jgi:hypothetical protein
LTRRSRTVSQPGVTRNVIGIGGASCGVNNSIQTASRHPEVKSPVMLSGNGNLAGRNSQRSSAAPPAFYTIADDEFPLSIIAIERLYSLGANPARELLASDITDPEERRNAIRESSEQKLKQPGDKPQ